MRCEVLTLFGQVFSDNFVNLGLVSSIHTGFFSRCCFPQKPAGRRGYDVQPGACFRRRSELGDTGRSPVGSYRNRPLIHPKCTSAEVRRPRLWCRRANVSIQPLSGFRSVGVVPQIDLLVRHTPPEPLHKDVVPRPASRINADQDLGLGQSPREGHADKLRALVGVEDLGLAARQCLVYGL